MIARATGRWNRDQSGACRPELVWDGTGVWAACSACNFLGPLRHTREEADADGDRHEREVFEQRSRGRRFVRGRWE